MYTFSDESKATAVGLLNTADVAAPPSPEYPFAPVPAIVKMMSSASAVGDDEEGLDVGFEEGNPAFSTTIRIRLLLESATYTFPDESKATP